MSGPERKRPQFAPEQEKSVDFYASLFAELGEGAIDDLRKERYGFMKLKLLLLKTGSREAIQTAQALDHDIALVNEIIDRADENMKKAGTDGVSMMRKLIVRERLGYLNDQEFGEEKEE